MDNAPNVNLRASATAETDQAQLTIATGVGAVGIAPLVETTGVAVAGVAAAVQETPPAESRQDRSRRLFAQITGGRIVNNGTTVVASFNA